MAAGRVDFEARIFAPGFQGALRGDRSRSGQSLGGWSIDRFATTLQVTRDALKLGILCVHVAYLRSYSPFSPELLHSLMPRRIEMAVVPVAGNACPWRYHHFCTARRTKAPSRRTGRCSVPISLECAKTRLRPTIRISCRRLRYRRSPEARSNVRNRKRLEWRTTHQLVLCAHGRATGRRESYSSRRQIQGDRAHLRNSRELSIEDSLIFRVGVVLPANWVVLNPASLIGLVNRRHERVPLPLESRTNLSVTRIIVRQIALRSWNELSMGWLR